MLQVGVLSSLAAALIFGVYLFVYKRSFDSLPSTVYVASVEVAGFCWYAVIAALTWPGGEPLVPTDFGTRTALLLVGVCAAIAAANLVSIRAFKLGDVSYVAPLNKLVPAFVLPIEIVVLAAQPTPIQVVGLALAVVAIYVANYEGGALLVPFRRAASYRPAQLALAGAVLFAISDVGTRGLLSRTGLTPQAVALATFAAVALVALPLAARRVVWANLRPAVPGIVALAALFAVGVHLTMTAFAVAPASVVSPIVNTQAVVAVLLGGVLLREKGLPRRLAAAVLAVSGVALIAVG
ncbi:DMT family transporter [Salinibaculum salinum]|uniref:DMT family transporter n=1 Tax=Salinibaculum salinum TaxID=3131996 RepID=UPI0030ED34BB